MQNLEQTLASLNTKNSNVERLNTLFGAIEAQLKEVLTTTGASGQTQTQFTEIFTNLKNNTVKIDKALSSNS